MTMCLVTSSSWWKRSVVNKCKGLNGISPAVINYVLSGSRDSVLADVTRSMSAVHHKLTEIFFTHLNIVLSTYSFTIYFGEAPG